MSKKVEELLAVLDLPEREQKLWLAVKGIINIAGDERDAAYLTESLADLAFRLRDEVNRTEFHNGIYKIQQYLKQEDWATAFWGETQAQPIHWIIAAIIVKEMSKS